jgi:DNA-binding beta-propeller fold protein YncE
MVAHVQVGQTPGPVTLGGQWAFVPNMSDGAVSQIDRSNGQIVATIRVGDIKVLRDRGCAPDSVHAYYSGSWGWRACDTPYAIAWDGAYLWALDNGRHQLVRVDPIKHVIDHRVDLPGAGWSIAVGEGKAWVSGYPDHAIYVVDVQTQLLSAILTDLDLGPATLAYGAGGVWVVCAAGTNGIGFLDQIDPATAKVIGRHPIEWWSEDVAAAQNSVYVRGSFGGDISRINVATGAVAWTQPGPGFIGRQGIDQLGATAKGVWMSGPTTALIDAETGQIVDKIPVASSAVAADNGEVWVLEIDGSVAKFRWQ